MAWDIVYYIGEMRGFYSVERRKAVLGNPQFISTSYVERQNLILRVSQLRFTRLTNEV
jgi:hypothetical protein